MGSPITVFWDNLERNIVRWDCNGNWLWDEFYAAIDDTRALVRQAKHRSPPFIIINLEASGPFPASALAYLRPCLPLLPCCQSVIIVQPSGFARSMISLLQNLTADYQKKIILADTLESAHRHTTLSLDDQ